MKGISVSRQPRTIAIAVVLGCATAMGCYSYVPSQASYLTPGRDVALQINDLGRVNLTAQIGAEVAQVAGILQQQTGTDYTMKVSELTYLNGKTAEWSGEPVTIRQDFAESCSGKEDVAGQDRSSGSGERWCRGWCHRRPHSDHRRDRQW